MDYKARTLLNSKLKTDLEDTTIPEDVRVKQYQQSLNRFLHTSRKQPVPEPVLEPLPEPILKPESNPLIPRSRSKKHTIHIYPRIKRNVTKPKWFAWDLREK